MKLILFNWPCETWKLGPAATLGGTKPLGIVEIQTVEGISGHSFLGSARFPGNYFAKGLIEFVKPLILGQNPQDIGAIWKRLWNINRDVMTHVICAVDICLWDINGKLAGQPIHRLIGTCKSRVPAYSSSAYHETKEAYAEEAVHFKELGWKAHKIHPHGNSKSDIEICMKVREAVGTDMTLMLDACWAYQFGSALRVGRAIEELDFYWYEDPLAEEDVYNYVKLLRKLEIPVMSTEFAPGRLYGMAQWIMQYATDIVRGDVAVFGGITPLVRLCHMADGFKLKCEIHHGGNSLNNVANLHVTMAVPNCEFFEVFPCTGANKFGLVEDIEVDRDGYVYAPDKPGLGFEIDWDLVGRNHMATLE